MSRLSRLLRVAVVAALVAVAAPVAPAEPVGTEPVTDDGMPSFFRVHTPAGWAVSAADRLAESLAASAQLGPELRAGARVWTAPTPGTSLVVTWLAAAPASGPEAAIRAQLDAVRAAPLSAAPGETEIARWHESLASGVVEARLAWQRPGDGVSSTSRTLVVRTAGGLRLASAECMRGPDAAEPDVSACEAAAESLAIALPEAELLAFDAAAVAGSAAAVAGSAAAQPQPPAAGTSDLPRLTLRDPGQLPRERPVITVERERGRDHRTWLYALGALLLVAAFYLTTRRDRREDEDEDKDKEKP